MSVLPLTSVGALARPHGHGTGAGRGEQPRGRLVRCAATLRHLAGAVLGVAVRSAATVGLVMLAVLWAEAAHDLAVGSRGGQVPTGRRDLPGGVPDWAASR